MGRFKGGLAMAAVLASAAFGSICGSSVATAATITGVALPEMKRHGYSGRLSTGTLAAGGTLGILIPPSVPLVIYAILTEQNIAKLFAAAMVPGLIAMLGYMVAIAIYVRVVPGQAPEVDDDIERFSLAALAGIAPIATIFVIVFGGIYGGYFTPTEGAGVGAASTFVAVQALLLCNGRKLGHDLHDFHWCGCHELFPGLDTSAESVGRSSGRMGALTLDGRHGRLAFLCGAWRRHGRAQHDFAHHPHFLPHDHGARLWHGQGTHRHLVWDHGAHDRRIWHVGTAGGFECLCCQQHGQGCAHI
jgi:hypothetical protein